MAIGKTRHLSFSELDDGPQKRSVSSIRLARTISIETIDGDVQTVSNRINAMGFGSYQLQVFILCAGFIIAEATCIQMASGMSRAVAVEFGLLSNVRKAMPMTVIFVGMACGTLASGPFGDAYGRRLPMFIGYAGLIATSILTFFLPTLTLFCILFFILGFFAGFGVPTALITLSESTPDANRGPVTGALGIAFCFGELWAAIGLRIILPDLLNGPWRYLVLWAAIPATCLLTFGLVSPVTRYDTAHFLGVRGRNGELVGAINLIAKLNRRPECALELGEALSVDNHEALNFKDAMLYLSAWPLVLYTAIQSLMFFTKDLGFFGMGVFWPLAWKESNFRIQNSTELVVTAAIGIPGVGIAMAIMYLLPRRIALSSSAIICAVAAFIIKGVLTKHTAAFIGVIIFKLFFPTLQMVTMLFPSEVFPTQVRVWAWSFVSFFGRIAAIVAPMIVNASKTEFLHSCSALALAIAVFVWALPETKDCELNCLDEDAIGGKGVGPKYGSMGYYECKYTRSETW